MKAVAVTVLLYSSIVAVVTSTGDFYKKDDWGAPCSSKFNDTFRGYTLPAFRSRHKLPNPAPPVCVVLLPKELWVTVKEHGLKQFGKYYRHVKDHLGGGDLYRYFMNLFISEMKRVGASDLGVVFNKRDYPLWFDRYSGRVVQNASYNPQPTGLSHRAYVVYSFTVHNNNSNNVSYAQEHNYVDPDFMAARRYNNTGCVNGIQFIVSSKIRCLTTVKFDDGVNDCKKNGMTRFILVDKNADALLGYFDFFEDTRSLIFALFKSKKSTALKEYVTYRNDSTNNNIVNNRSGDYFVQAHGYTILDELMKAFSERKAITYDWNNVYSPVQTFCVEEFWSDRAKEVCSLAVVYPSTTGHLDWCDTFAAYEAGGSKNYVNATEIKESAEPINNTTMDAAADNDTTTTTTTVTTLGVVVNTTTITTPNITMTEQQQQTEEASFVKVAATTAAAAATTTAATTAAAETTKKQTPNPITTTATTPTTTTPTTDPMPPITTTPTITTSPSAADGYSRFPLSDEGQEFKNMVSKLTDRVLSLRSDHHSISVLAINIAASAVVVLFVVGVLFSIILFCEKQEKDKLRRRLLAQNEEAAAAAAQQQQEEGGDDDDDDSDDSSDAASSTDSNNYVDIDLDTISYIL